MVCREANFLGFEMAPNGAHAILGRRVQRLADDVGTLGRLVRIVDAGKVQNFAAARTSVHAFHVARFADRKRRIYVNFEEFEAAEGSADGIAIRSIGADCSANSGASVPHDFFGDEGDAHQVDVPVFAGKLETRRQNGAHRVAVEQRHRGAARFERGREGASNSGFPGTGQACKPGAKASSSMHY